MTLEVGTLIDQAVEEGALLLQLDVSQLESLHLHGNYNTIERLESLFLKEVFGSASTRWPTLREVRYVGDCSPSVDEIARTLVRSVGPQLQTLYVSRDEGKFFRDEATGDFFGPLSGRRLLYVDRDLAQGALAVDRPHPVETLILDVWSDWSPQFKAHHILDVLEMIEPSPDGEQRPFLRSTTLKRLRLLGLNFHNNSIRRAVRATWAFNFWPHIIHLDVSKPVRKHLRALSPDDINSILTCLQHAPFLTSSSLTRFSILNLDFSF